MGLPKPEGLITFTYYHDLDRACEFYGEVIMAWVRLQEPGAAGEEELRSWCKAGLAHFKVPRYIWLVERFPMTGSGKLQKVQMREEALVRLKRDRPAKER